MSASKVLPRNRIIVGDALDRLSTLPDASVDCVITSPPYFRLRDYDSPGQLGLEAHVDRWVDQLATISEQVARVLVPTGTFWLNVGDSCCTRSVLSFTDGSSIVIVVNSCVGLALFNS